ncbi:transposable element Tcb1 transposase [Trichonephila clavipes]|nr:transposable element Tcb1 transposase [Trichonephila clavipes]
MAVTDRSVTSRTVAQHIESITHHSVSERTIRRRLQQSGLSARRPLLGLPLTQNHRRLRRQWCDEGRATAIFQRDNARPHGSRIVQRIFVNQQIGLRPWLARSPDLSPIENTWPTVAQRLTQISPSGATPDQLWQRVEAAWSTVPQEHIQSLFQTMPRRVAVARIKGPYRLIPLELTIEQNVPIQRTGVNPEPKNLLSRYRQGRETDEQSEISTGTPSAIWCEDAQSGCETCSQVPVRGIERTPSYSCRRPTGHYQL